MTPDQREEWEQDAEADKLAEYYGRIDLNLDNSYEDEAECNDSGGNNGKDQS